MHIYLAQSQIGVCVVMQFSDVLERNTLLDVSHQNGFHYGVLFGHRVLITDGFLYGHRVLHGSGQRHHSAPPRLAPKAGTWDEELDKRVCLFAAHKRDGEAANNAAGQKKKAKKARKNARIAEASKAGIAEAKEAGITKGEIQTKEAQLAQAKLKWRAELPKHRAMAEHVKKEMFDSEDEEDLVAGLYTECGFDMHATYARLFFL